MLCLALSSKLRSAKANFKLVQEKKGNSIESSASEYAEIQFYTDLYVESMGNISQILHPFYEGFRQHTQEMAEIQIRTELSRIEQVIDQCKIKDNYNLFNKAQNQVSDVIAVIPVWHNFVSEQVAGLQLQDNVKLWFESYLLPKMYWEQALNKTKYTPTREQLKKQIIICEQNAIPMPTLPEKDYKELKDKAIYLSTKFQRASSRVEGRNGFLSQINHNQKSFDQTRLEVMTVIHNFDTRGIDRKTPAERLFGETLNFEPLFDYIVKNFHDLPQPRKRNKYI